MATPPVAEPQAMSPRANKVGQESRDLPSEAQAERTINAIVKDQPRADELYDQIPESGGGKVIGTDIARELLPEYRTREGRIAFTDATSHAAGKYAADRLLREIDDRGERRILMLTAGGIAAGMTTAVIDEMMADSDLVHEGTR